MSASPGSKKLSWSKTDLIASSPVSTSPGSKKLSWSETLLGQEIILVQDGSYCLQPSERLSWEQEIMLVRDGSYCLQPGERLSWEQEIILVRDGSFSTANPVRLGARNYPGPRRIFSTANPVSAFPGSKKLSWSETDLSASSPLLGARNYPGPRRILLPPAQ